MTTKIDLAEIEKRARHIREYLEGEMRVKDRHLRFPYTLPLSACDQIAAALEALPALVEIVGELKGFCEESIEEFNYPKLNELLDYFTAKTPQP
jgi:hypothetical protein